MPKDRRTEDLAWKLIFGCICEHLGIPLETEREVGKLPRAIDGVAQCPPEKLPAVAPLSPFPNLTEFNALEGKGITDRLTVEGYHLIQARLRLYAADLKLEDCSRLSLYICCATRPARLLYQLPRLVRFERLAPGIYRADEKFPVYVLVAPELAPEPRHGPLLLMGKEEQRRRVIEAWLREGRTTELALAMELFPQTTREVMEMAGKRREPIDIEANLRYIADWVGVETFTKPLSAEERLLGLSLEERLAGLSKEERQQLRELLLAEEATSPPSPARRRAGASRRAPARQRG